MDSCDNCVGGDTGEGACTEDCAGEWGGTAIIDNCGECVEGNTGVEACTEDCEGNWGGNLVEDCNGVCGGTAVLDDCGICDGQNLNCIVDIDGNGYKTIQIGDQIWMTENLRSNRFNNGDSIIFVESVNFDWDLSEWENSTIPSYGYYDDDEGYQNIYGNFYNWYAVDDERGICPEGWYVPSDYEFRVLEITLGMSESEASSQDWRGTNEGSKLAGNSNLWSGGVLISDPDFGISGFNALPNGYRSGGSGIDKHMGGSCYLWLSDGVNENQAWFRRLDGTVTNIARWDGGNLSGGFCVRCIRD